MEREFKNMFVCMKCNAKLRSDPFMVREGKVKCRKCGSKDLRMKAKERRGAEV